MSDDIVSKCIKCGKMHTEITKKCDKCKEKARLYRENNKEKISKKEKEAYAANPEKKKANANARYAEKKEDIRAKVKAERAENPEKIRAQNRSYANSREGKKKKILIGAKSRGMSVTMTDEEIMSMTDLPCVYCGKETEDAIRRNGIDRIDSSIGYDLSNCVPCCSICNKSKGQVDPLTFIERAKQISLCQGDYGEITDKWSQICKQKFCDYKHIILKNNKIFDLTKEEFEELRSKDCEYCGRSTTLKHQNGIDCVNYDPAIGYIISNCVPACRDCNFMKQTMTYEEFIALMKKVAMCDYDFGDVSRVLTTFTPKKKDV